MLQNASFPAFNISEYLKENQQGKGVGWGAKKIRVKNLFEKLTKNGEFTLWNTSLEPYKLPLPVQSQQ